MDRAPDAMRFARDVHKNQRRKYTNNPYFDHLAEVVGITMSGMNPGSLSDVIMATAWLHDCIEDQNVPIPTLNVKFGYMVTHGVIWLTELGTGNRATRKQNYRTRISLAPGWVQTIKVADIISNTGSIIQHDPAFAELYLKECSELLDALTQADQGLVAFAREGLCQT